MIEWVRLSFLDLGKERVKEILEKTGSLSQFFSLSRNDLLSLGFDEEEADEILNPPPALEDAVKKIEKLNIKVIPFISPAYPASLNVFPASPPVLFVRGEIKPEDENACGIVGTRLPSDYGRKIAYDTARKLAERGVTVVSGLARGIDTQAHLGALEGNGRTIGVLGCGPDRIYPASARAIAERIMENGAIVSEFPPGTPPLKHHFPRRNRIISGLSRVLLVVEATMRSGTFSTVSWALEQGKEVFAVPGDITRRTSEGTNYLIKSGARVFTSWEDLSSFLNLTPPERKPVELSQEEKLILSLLEEPRTLDYLIAKTDLSPQRLFSLLLLLEVKGKIREIGGKRWERIEF
ncbi:DNA-protecting protein DprA [bacterium]|nr:MAG: DNA-protecting protein DprA [bacterium]